MPFKLPPAAPVGGAPAAITFESPEPLPKNAEAFTEDKLVM